MELKRYGHQDAPDVRALLLDIHDEAYANEPAEFHSRERFAEFVEAWSGKETWACVVGYESGEPVGFAYGASFGPTRPPGPAPPAGTATCFWTRASVT